MRLDNRSRTIHVSGEALQNDEAHMRIGQWYEENGGSMTPLDDGVTFTFPNREMAEKVSDTSISLDELTSRYLRLEQQPSLTEASSKRRGILNL